MLKMHLLTNAYNIQQSLGKPKFAPAPALCHIWAWKRKTFRIMDLLLNMQQLYTIIPLFSLTSARGYGHVLFFQGARSDREGLFISSPQTPSQLPYKVC